ncbi:MAG: Arc family DNA-binding protein [Gemmatimonas sp.]
MAERKSFLLRMDRELLDAVQRWANDDLRSLNGQIEFLLRRALQQAGRKPLTTVPSDSNQVVDHEGDS